MPTESNLDKMSPDMEKMLKRMRAKIDMSFARAAEEGVNECKLNHGYTDRTSNLTKSIGYVTLTAASHKEGLSNNPEGNAYLAKVAASFQGERHGFALCAGMSYSAQVARRGFAVLENGELAARSMINQLLPNILK